jgi:hypothetical protein
MSSTQKVRLQLNARPGSLSEPRVTNEEQLESFGRYGVWVRTLTAYRLIVSTTSDNLALSQVSTVVGFYEQLGMFYEDICFNSCRLGSAGG